jgi:microcystin-dependent protein
MPYGPCLTYYCVVGACGCGSAPSFNPLSVKGVTCGCGAAPSAWCFFVAGRACGCGSELAHIVEVEDVITGAILPFAAAAAPAGYLLCNGQQVSRSTYAALFAAIGTTWGAGDGSTTFTLPNLQGYALIGRGTFTDAQGAVNYNLAQAVGERQHLLTVNEIPAHSHTTPTLWGYSGPAQVAGGASLPLTATSSTASTGGGMMHNNVQPSMPISWVIKT